MKPGMGLIFIIVFSALLVLVVVTGLLAREFVDEAAEFWKEWVH